MAYKKNNPGFIQIICMLCVFTLASCNSDDSKTSSDSFDWGVEAYFLDSAVVGLSYQSEFPENYDVERALGYDPGVSYLSRLTNAEGAYTFFNNTQTTFLIDEMVLGSITLDYSQGGVVITPIDITDATPDNFRDNQRVRNILRLLQTLDRDGDPDNGINLLGRNIAFKDGDIDLDADDTAFETQFESLLNVAMGATAPDIVSADDALDHFDLTLAALNSSESMLAGTWEIRDGAWGDFMGLTTLNNDNSGVTVEYGGDCGDFLLVNQNVAETNCPRKETHDFSWSFIDGTLSFQASGFEDSCRFISGNAHTFQASCQVFVGNGNYEYESQRFVRHSDRFDERLLQYGKPYTFYNVDQSHTAQELSYITFNENGTGNYQNLDDDTVDFDWSISPDGSKITLETSDESIEMNFKRYIAGTFEVGEENVDLMIPSPGNMDILNISQDRVNDRSCFDLLGGYSLECSLDFEEIEHSEAREVMVATDGGQFICRQFQYFATANIRYYWLGCNEQDGSEFRYILLRLGESGR